MSFSPGTRFGPYEITAQIGVGGMGDRSYRFAMSLAPHASSLAPSARSWYQGANALEVDTDRSQR